MPALMSKKFGIPCSATKLADGLVVLGVLFLGGRDDVVEDDDDLSGALTFLTPSFLNSWMMASELSCERT